LKGWWGNNAQTPSALVANFDETMGVVTDAKVKVFVPRSVRQPIVKATPTADEHITIGVFIFADGTRMKKLNVVLPLKNMPDLHVDLSNPDALRGSIIDKFTWHGQESGWITAPIMRQIISEVVNAFSFTIFAFLDYVFTHKLVSPFSCPLSPSTVFHP